MAKKTNTARSKSASAKHVVALTHEEAKRKNIPTAEFQPVLAKELQSPVQVAFARRNRDLDPQLVWRGKDDQDWSDLVVPAPPLFIQEKVHPKALIDDLLRRTKDDDKAKEGQIDLFADFNGLPDSDAKTEFYQHDAHWANRMILGDSLQVMASLAEREGLRGQVQCIYFDPPYGIKFNSNFQWSTTSTIVRDGNREQITREPEQVKAFRDTWRDGVHSYLTYLRDRLSVARDMLTESGSMFVQISSENLHHIIELMDEVFGSQNRLNVIPFTKTSGVTTQFLASRVDYLVWYGRDRERAKYRSLFFEKSVEAGTAANYGWVELTDGTRRGVTAVEKNSRDLIPTGARIYKPDNIGSQGNPAFEFVLRGKSYAQPWKTNANGMKNLAAANRLHVAKNSLQYVRYITDFPCVPVTQLWEDTQTGSFTDEKTYVVQTGAKVIERCLLMATDPGDLVLDPTCGSGTTAYVAEQWGRRWITIDTSRVALTLARARIMGARYPYYLKADSREGQLKEAEVTRSAPSSTPTHNSLRQGFVYERVPHITLKSIANNAEIDVIGEKFQQRLEPLRATLNKALGKKWEEWEIPRTADDKWPKDAKEAHARWWEQRIARQKEMDASIAAKAEFEYLYDKPYEDKRKVRVAGPFTVESLSPHRTLGVDENDELIDPSSPKNSDDAGQDFAAMILENLRAAGVQQAHKEDRISFSAIAPWPGRFICAEGKYTEGDGGKEKRAAIFIGPEFGTVSRQDLVVAAREAGDADFDVLIACAFNFEAHASEFNKLGRIPVLKARMNAELHMGSELKTTGKGNLFVIFGEPDIEIAKGNDGQYRVKIVGVDVFHPQTGEVRSDGAEGIACWFIDTDYNEESFFVRHAYFLGANDPYKALKTTLKAEINEEAWSTLHSDTSRPFPKPKGSKIAVKVINHLGDEVMKVFKVE